MGCLIPSFTGAFTWPESIGHIPLRNVLDDESASVDSGAVIDCDSLCGRNVEAALKRLGFASADACDDEYVIDVDCTAKFRSRPCSVSPCLLHSRSRGYWLLRRQRRFTAAETGRLQGIGSGRISHRLTDGVFRGACGNAMSVSVLMRVLARLLPCAGLTGPLVDAWDVLAGERSAEFTLGRGVCVPLPLDGYQTVRPPPIRVVDGHVDCSCPPDADLPDPCSSFDSDDASWRALGKLGRCLCGEPGFADIFVALKRPAPPCGRVRDLFPLPLIGGEYLDASDLCGAGDRLDAAAYLDSVVVGLNWMYGARVEDIGERRPTAAQVEAHRVIIEAASALHTHLTTSLGNRESLGWNAFEAAGSAPPLALDAGCVSVPTCAGTCDPRLLITGALLNSISDASVIFPNPPPGLDRFAGFYSGPRSEYIALTVRQLRVGLLRLGSSCRGGGTVFPVGKSDGKSQRVVWHGTRVSLAATRPPAPRHLADPSVFGSLDLRPTALLRVSKRDCRTWFDQLVVDEGIGEFFGRPAVSRAELLGAGVTCEEIATFGGAADCFSFVPCSQVWPMGFSWSSCVAQETLLSICSRSGLGTSRVLSVDAPLPGDLSVVFAVATDDLMVFSDAGPGATSRAVSSVEDVMKAHGIVKAPEKDIDDVLSATCVGVDLVEGTKWWTPGARIWKLLDGITELSSSRFSSPGAVAGFYGVAGWYDLLRRLRLSVFHHVYDFSSGAKAKDWRVTSVPDAVIGELLLDSVLSLFGSVDMRLPFLPTIGATDASTVFGLGATVADLPVDEVRRIARLACKGGAHVCLDDGPELNEALAARLGPRHDLQLKLKDFSVVLCIRVVSPGHINLEEGNALVSYIRWILRSRSRFRHRIVILIDSKVVIGAVTKGRSSSVPLNAIVRRLACLCFAGGLILHCIFVPTSHNPGDWPSRGGPETWPPELQKSGRSAPRVLPCPACGVLPANHPLDRPKVLRGTGLCCRGTGTRYAFDHRTNVWVSDIDMLVRRIRGCTGTSRGLINSLDRFGA